MWMCFWARRQSATPCIADPVEEEYTSGGSAASAPQTDSLSAPNMSKVPPKTPAATREKGGLPRAESDISALVEQARVPGR